MDGNIPPLDWLFVTNSVLLVTDGLRKLVWYKGRTRLEKEAERGK